jgi:hypothetical protein
VGILDRFKNAYNAFTPTTETTDKLPFDQGYMSPLGAAGTFGTAFSTRPDQQRRRTSNDRSIVTSIYTRIAIDCASVQLRHVRRDDQDRYLEDIISGLNSCLTLEANIDQAARMFRQDLYMTLCDEGIAALVPVDTTQDPSMTNSYDILTMRIGKVVQWYPKHVRVSLWNENSGKREEITLSKTIVAIVENPLYAVMNEPNSTLQRLIRKLSLLDSVDEASASGKLDLIIQLPYVIKSEARRQQAVQRRTEIEDQLKNGGLGIAYTDGTEKITQLNRPVENNLLGQIEYLTTSLYGELGITKEVMDGTANEAIMLNYWNRTIEPMVSAAVEAMRRTFLTKTARSQKQTVDYFRDPFALVPVSAMADIADKFTRNEIMSSNEIRQEIGMKPSKDPKADQLVNSNINPSTPPGTAAAPAADSSAPADDSSAAHTDMFDSLDSTLDDLYKSLGVTEEKDDAA